MKLRVDKELCIGCGACAAVCPDCFEFDDDGQAKCTVDEIPSELEEDALDAKEGCPTGAIQEVEE